MFYTIYRTTNLITGQYYIGKHQTENPNDGYLGSGKWILAAIKKYGRRSFQKQVLFVFDTELQMNLKEKELITQEVVDDTTSYNLGVGGEGGPHFKGKKHSDETRAKISAIKQRQKRVYRRTAEDTAKMRAARIANSGEWAGAETRRKLSNLVWMYDLTAMKNKRVPGEQVDLFTRNGYIKGKIQNSRGQALVG